MVSKSLSKAYLALLICPKLDIHEEVILTTCGPNERFESKSRPRSLAEGTGVSSLPNKVGNQGFSQSFDGSQIR